jgi:hypothetical protein
MTIQEIESKITRTEIKKIELTVKHKKYSNMLIRELNNLKRWMPRIKQKLEKIEKRLITLTAKHNKYMNMLIASFDIVPEIQEISNIQEISKIANIQVIDMPVSTYLTIAIFDNMTAKHQQEFSYQEAKNNICADVFDIVKQYAKPTETEVRNYYNSHWKNIEEGPIIDTVEKGDVFSYSTGGRHVFLKILRINRLTFSGKWLKEKPNRKIYDDRVMITKFSYDKTEDENRKFKRPSAGKPYRGVRLIKANDTKHLCYAGRTMLAFKEVRVKHRLERVANAKANYAEDVEYKKINPHLSEGYLFISKRKLDRQMEALMEEKQELDEELKELREMKYIKLQNKIN